MICPDCKSNKELLTNGVCADCALFPQAWTSTKDGERVYLGRVTSWSLKPQFPNATEVTFPTEGPFRVKPEDVVMLQPIAKLGEAEPFEFVPAKSDRRLIMGVDPGVSPGISVGVVAGYDLDLAGKLRPLFQTFVPALEQLDDQMNRVIEAMQPYGIKPITNFTRKTNFVSAVDAALIEACKLSALGLSPELLKGETTYSSSATALRLFRQKLGLPPEDPMPDKNHVIPSGRIASTPALANPPRSAPEYDSRVFAVARVLRTEVTQDQRMPRSIVHFTWRQRSVGQHADGVAEFIPTCGCEPFLIADTLRQLGKVSLYLLWSERLEKLGVFLGYACVCCSKLQRFSEASHARVENGFHLQPDPGEDLPLRSPTGEDFSVLGLRQLVFGEYLFRDDLEQHVVKGTVVFKPVHLPGTGAVAVTRPVFFREIRYADPDKKSRFLDSFETLLPGDVYNEDHPSPFLKMDPSKGRWVLVKGAIGHKVPKRRHPYETSHVRFVRSLTQDEKQTQLLASMCAVKDPYERARLAQVELGVDRDVKPEKVSTPYEPRIQVQDGSADDI